jgi:hypothetical protein
LSHSIWYSLNFLFSISSSSLTTGRPGNFLRSLTRDRMVSPSTRRLHPRSERSRGMGEASCLSLPRYKLPHLLIVDSAIRVHPEEEMSHRCRLFSRIRSDISPGASRLQTGSLIAPKRNTATSSRCFSCMKSSFFSLTVYGFRPVFRATIFGKIWAGIQFGRVVSSRLDSPFVLHGSPAQYSSVKFP